MARVGIEFDGNGHDAVRAAHEVKRAIGGIDDQAATTSRRTSSEMHSLEQSVSRTASGIERSLGRAARLGIFAVGAAAGTAAGYVGMLGLSFYRTQQQAEIAFTTMLNSGTRARKFLGELADFAARTPFEFKGLILSTQQMMAMGFEAKEIIPSMTAIGDAVAALGGSEEVLYNVTRALGQMRMSGRVNAQDMNQLTQAGIAGWRYLAEAAGKSVAETRKLSEKGMIDGSAAVQAILAGMNRDFQGMMDEQSKTFTGRMSTMKDTIAEAAATGLTPLFEMVEQGMKRVSESLSSPEGQAGVRRLAAFIETDLIGAVQRLVDWVGRNRDEIVSMASDGAAALGGLLRALHGVGVGLRTIADLVGGWDKVFYLLLSGRLLLAVNKLTMGFTLLAGSQTAAGATGIGGAAGAAARLRANLLLLPAFVPIVISAKILSNYDDLPEGLKKLLSVTPAGAALFIADKISGDDGPGGSLGERAGSTLGTVTGRGSGGPSRDTPGTRAGNRVAGNVTLRSGADRPGTATKQVVLDFVNAISAQMGGDRLTIGTGSAHNRLTTSGNVSQHWTGNAADIPATGGALTKMGRAALVAAGADQAWAAKQKGGLYNIGGFQIIFNSNIGGNHYNHLHVGVRDGTEIPGSPSGNEDPAGVASQDTTFDSAGLLTAGTGTSTQSAAMTKAQRAAKEKLERFAEGIGLKRQFGALAGRVRSRLGGFDEDTTAELLGLIGAGNLTISRAFKDKLITEKELKSIDGAFDKLSDRVQRGVDKVRDAFNRSFDRFRDLVSKALSELGGEATLDRRRQGLVASDATALIGQVLGSGDVSDEERRVQAAGERVRAAWKTYSEALTAGNREAIETSAAELVEAEKRFESLSEQGLADRAGKLFEAYKDLIGVVSDQERKLWDTMSDEQEDAVQTVLDNVQDLLGRNKISYAEARRMLSAELTKLGLDVDQVGQLLGDPFQQTMIRALNGIESAVDRLIAALRGVKAATDDLGGPAPTRGRSVIPQEDLADTTGSGRFLSSTVTPITSVTPIQPAALPAASTPAVVTPVTIDVRFEVHGALDPGRERQVAEQLADEIRNALIRRQRWLPAGTLFE